MQRYRVEVQSFVEIDSTSFDQAAHEVTDIMQWRASAPDSAEVTDVDVKVVEKL